MYNPPLYNYKVYEYADGGSEIITHEDEYSAEKFQELFEQSVIAATEDSHVNISDVIEYMCSQFGFKQIVVTVDLRYNELIDPREPGGPLIEVEYCDPGEE